MEGAEVLSRTPERIPHDCQPIVCDARHRNRYGGKPVCHSLMECEFPNDLVTAELHLENGSIVLVFACAGLAVVYCSLRISSSVQFVATPFPGVARSFEPISLFANCAEKMLTVHSLIGFASHQKRRISQPTIQLTIRFTCTY